MTESTGRIELKLRKVSQLFHTLDPSPFRESDLSLQAEEYIVDSALELPKTVPIEIVIHLPWDEFSQSSAFDISGAIKSYFGLRSKAVSGEMRELFKVGRLSLVVALLVLSFCLLLAWAIGSGLKEGPVSQILQESFVIFGWVAIWKPADIFLYSWPPIARRRKLLSRLAEATVTVDGDAPNPA
ncbi:MAG TPA: hypothetical protein VIX42_02350 [Edaphobacter sp.]